MDALCLLRRPTPAPFPKSWLMVGVSILTYVLAWESLVALFHGVQQTLHLG